MSAQEGFIMFLTPDEIREATGRVQHHAQAKALRALGIVFKIRSDGSLLVLRAHVETQLGLEAPKGKKVKEFTPNWDAANA